MGPRRTILHRLASAITIHPAFDGRPRTLEPGSDLGNRDVVVNDELSNPQTSAWSQSCVNMGHKRAFLAVDIFASPTQPARPSPTSHARITILQPTSPVSTTSSVTRTPTDDKRGVTPSQIRFELNIGIDNHTLHKLPPTQLTHSHTGAAKPCPSPHSHQPPATHGLSSHRSQSAQHSAARRDSTHARDVRPPHITPRESHRRSPSSYGRSPAPRRQPGRALRDLR